MPEPVTNNAVCEGFSTEGSFIYSFGGIDSTLAFDGIHLKSWRINTQTTQIDVLPDLPDTLGKIAAAASRVDNIIYIIGGYHVLSNGNEISSNKVHRFDVTANQFIADGATIPVPIDDHVQAVYRDSLIFVVTGWSNTSNVPDVQIYNTYSDTWQVGSSVPNNNNYKCFGASGEILGDTIYYFGGAAGFNFSAQAKLRKGFINTSDPTDITWQEDEPIPTFSGYRSAACKTAVAIHWLGGSSVSYNYDAIAYNGSGVVLPAARDIFYHPNSGNWGSNALANLPMDLRGVSNISSTEKYLIGGIGEAKNVSNKVIELNYIGTLGIADRSLNNSSPFLIQLPNSITLLAEGFLVISDMSGKTMMNRSVKRNEKVDLSNLTTGVYYVTLNFQNVRRYQKIVVLK